MNDLPLFDGIERFAAVRELEVRGANVSRQVFAADRHGVAQAHRIIEIDDGIDRSHLAIAQHPPAQGFRRAGRPLGFCAKGAEYLVPGLQVRLRPLRLAGDNRLAGASDPTRGARTAAETTSMLRARKPGASAETCGLIDGNTLFIG